MLLVLIIDKVDINTVKVVFPYIYTVIQGTLKKMQHLKST